MTVKDLNLNKLETESNNKNTKNIDSCSTTEMLNIINNEDKLVPDAVEKEIHNIAIVVDKIAEAFQKGGRLIYVGAGTSGRLGVLDASECPPTFGTPPEMVQGFIAGGDYALRKAIEGAEDDKEDGHRLIKEINLTDKDVVVGITASGRAKYVLGALEEANSIGAYTAGLCTNKETDLHQVCETTIAPLVGPEAIQGSTRLKSGTAQKLVLNMLTTGAMIKIGKVYKNYMVDMKASNEKLLDRAVRLVMLSTEVTYEQARGALEECDFHVKSAIIMIVMKVNCEEAQALLADAQGYVAKVIN